MEAATAIVNDLIRQGVMPSDGRSVTELAAANPNLQEYLTQVEKQRDDAQMRVAELEARPLAFADAKVIDEHDDAIARAGNNVVAQLTQARDAALHAQDHFQEVARLAQEERAQAINMNNVLTKERDDAIARADKSDRCRGKMQIERNAAIEATILKGMCPCHECPHAKLAEVIGQLRNAMNGIKVG
jgi:aminopeptidase N